MQYLGKDKTIVVVSKSAAHLVIIHAGTVLAFAPASGHLLGVVHSKLARPVVPPDDLPVTVAVCQHLQ